MTDTEHRVGSVRFSPPAGPVVFCRNDACKNIPITPTDEDRAASRSNHDILWTPREPGDPEALREAFARHRRERNARPLRGGLGNDHNRGWEPHAITSKAVGMGKTWETGRNG